jgi:SAM-dependent methyltransferase
MRSVDISLPILDEEDGVQFMRELLGEIKAAQQGKHPDPASFPPGSSLWSLPAQLNRRAYDTISTTYQDHHFDLPLLADTFDKWLEQLQPGGHVLDAGCGHGDPVIARLLEHGFQVTGSDFSPNMLQCAARQFPQASFIQSRDQRIVPGSLL